MHIINVSKSCVMRLSRIFQAWSAPCKAMSPYFLALAKQAEYKNVRFLRVDISQCPVRGRSLIPARLQPLKARLPSAGSRPESRSPRGTDLLGVQSGTDDRGAAPARTLHRGSRETCYVTLSTRADV